MSSTKVICLESEGLSPFTTSAASYEKALQSVVSDCEAKYGPLTAVISRTVGRTTYNFGLFAGGDMPDVEASEQPQPTKAKRSKAKAQSEPEQEAA